MIKIKIVRGFNYQVQIYNILIFVFSATYPLIFATYYTNMLFAINRPFPPFAKVNNYS